MSLCLIIQDGIVMMTRWNSGIRCLWVFLVVVLMGGAGIAWGRPVKLAVIAAQSGQAEAYGRAAIQGVQLAVAEINAAGGLLGHPVDIVLFDSQSTPLKAKQAAEKAIERNVLGVVGDLWSTHSLAVAPLLQKAGIPMITPGSTAPDVTRVGDFIFRTIYTDDFQGRLMAEFALRSIGAGTAAVLTNLNETYSQMLGSFFVDAFVAGGGRIVFQSGYKGMAVDFNEMLVLLKPLEPQVVFIPGYSRDSGLIIRQAAGMGIKTIFLGGDAWETAISEYAGDALEGSYFSTPWHPSVPYLRSREFIEHFRAAFGNAPISPFVPLAYDAVGVMAAAVRRCNSLDRSLVRNALAMTEGYPGATGNLTFDAQGDPLKKGASILKFEKGRWVFFKAFEPQ
jgi:branched-chain amino acid transport system substrate-binding protein